MKPPPMLKNSSPLPCFTRSAPSFSVVNSGAWCGRMPNSPSPPGATTISTSPENRRLSCVTISKWSVAILRLLFHLLADFYGFVDRADHVERLLRQIVVFAFQNFTEAAHGLAQ